MSSKLLFEAINSHLEALQSKPPKRASFGREYVYDCPFCNHEGKLTINPEKGVFNCWTCGGERGDTRGSLRKLADLLGIEVEEDSVPDVEDISSYFEAKEKGNQVPVPAPEDNDKPIPYPPDSRPLDILAYNYLIGRGISHEKILNYNLFLATIGGIPRIIFPDFNREGYLRYWQGRVFLPQHRDRRDKYAAPAKDIASRGSKYYNWYRAINQSTDYIIVCEGPLSAIAAGYSAIAQWGKDCTKEQLVLLSSIRNKKILIAYDGDAWMQSTKTVEYLCGLGIDARVVPLPYEHDPLSIGEAEFQHRVDMVLQGKRFEYLAEIARSVI